MKLFLLSIYIALPITFVGCASNTPTTATTPAPPKQSVDQQMAAWLLTAQTAIEQAKTLVATNPGIKDPLNKIIASYNIAESGYLTYHQAVVAGTTPDATTLSASISQLVQNVSALVSLYGAKP